MTQTNSLSGLYAITDPCAGQYDSLYQHVEAALTGGTRILQYRDKSHDTQRRQEEASTLRALCRQHHCLFIINDDVTLAEQVHADGVHIGKDDAALQQARQQLGEQAIIGVSCYNNISLALEAEAAGADYVAFGRFFPSATKPDAIQAAPELLTQAKTRLNVPVVAIGGITLENGGQLIQHGADSLAVIQGVFGQPDIQKAAQRFTALFE
ncbi:MAG: thiamine phosphate synthase [Gammaproteobacteria bacterium]|nr:thiamine phosphate synthase [Gammaproteobacteria bacterium]